MRELVYYVGVSVDGFIAEADGSFDAFPVVGDHTEVTLGEYADALPGHVLDALDISPPQSRFDTVVMGWNTLRPALDIGIRSPYPHLHQVVASRRARTVADDVRLTQDPVATIRELKRAEGLDIWLCGGGQLAGHLASEIDRLVLKRYPLAFGAGIGMFGTGPLAPTPFALEAVRAYGSGVVIEEYRRLPEAD